MTVVGARENNLDINELRIPLGCVVGVCGVSGSGKSSLVVDTIGRAVAPIRHTTSIATEPVDPGLHEAILDAPPSAVVVTQSRGGLSSAADYFALPRALARAYEKESGGDLGADTLLRRCSACRGAGVIRTDLGFLTPVTEGCEVCGGSGYAAESAEERIRGYSLPEILSLTVEDVRSIWHDVNRIRAPLDLLSETGLGYLTLNQPGGTLSGGEVQRLKIVKELNRKTRGETLYILDEPTTGQSRREIAMLTTVLRRLTDAGEPMERSTVLVLEHSPDFLASCDWLIELGPGGGPDGGRVIAEGPPCRVAGGSTPTSSYLAGRIAAGRGARRPAAPASPGTSSPGILPPSGPSAGGS
jgi:excinuclease ABC subunit A